MSRVIQSTRRIVAAIIAAFTGRHEGGNRRMRMRIVAVAASLALASLAAAGAAQANIQTFTVDQKATILFSGQVAVTGTIRCNSGDDFQVAVALSQTQAGETAGGVGNTILPCTGSTQTWAVGVSPSQGDFRNGSSTGFVEAISPNVAGGDFTSLTTTIHLHK
jgi:hypothetical protein